MTVTVKGQVEAARDATLSYYNDTVNYGTQLKIDTGAIKDQTQVLYDQTLIIKKDVEQIEINVEAIQEDVNNKYEAISVLTEGLGFTIDANGHMWVTIPAETNLENIYIRADGHMIVELT